MTYKEAVFAVRVLCDLDDRGRDTYEYVKYAAEKASCLHGQIFDDERALAESKKKLTKAQDALQALMKTIEECK